jgi:hypothetical protein
MSAFHVSRGESARFTKTVGETDVYLFAGITGTSHPIMSTELIWSARASGGCRRMAHGYGASELCGIRTTEAPDGLR